MKQDELIQLVNSGNPVVVGEYRRTKAEVISWRDRETRQALSAPAIRHAIETAEEIFEVTEPTDRNLKPEDVIASYKCPLKKGQRVAIQIKEWRQEKGVVKCRGIVYPLDN